MKKILTSAILASTLFTVSGVSAYADTTVSDTTTTTLENQVLDKTISEIKDIIAPEVNVSQDGIKIEDKQAILDNLKSVNLDVLEQASREQGVIGEEDQLTEEKLLDAFSTGIDSLNQSIESGDLTVLDEGTMVPTNDDNFYLQGGSTYDVTYWWGKKRYKSTYYANKWASDLNTAANANAGAAVLAGAIFGGVGAIPNGLTAAYSYQLANKVSYYNSLSSRGIVANLTWLLVFTVNKQ
ncbi:hypothetical protein [Gottfriedia acidiceleris]|uniref:hypothetical protein n=1 Tax=Gottfriedia acidiceleris TaxID=371036 RepID=UPI00101D1564|nr:hypothetical protein [Gottfriedia acidiceleris]